MRNAKWWCGAKNNEAPQNFDSASRRCHPERSRGIFLALRSVSHRHYRKATPWCCTHPLFIGLHGRFLACARNDDTGVRCLLVTSHKSLAIRPCFQIFGAAISRIVIPSAAEGSFLHCGQYHIALAGKRRLGATYFCVHTCIVYRSARKISRFARNDDTRVPPRETLIKSLSDFILGFLYRARNHLTRIASYLRKMMTKLCIKIHMKSGSAI